jgi:hypothetical protein
MNVHIGDFKRLKKMSKDDKKSIGVDVGTFAAFLITFVMLFTSHIFNNENTALLPVCLNPSTMINR